MAAASLIAYMPTKRRAILFLDPPANVSLLFIGSGLVTWPSLSQSLWSEDEGPLMGGPLDGNPCIPTGAAS